MTPQPPSARITELCSFPVERQFFSASLEAEACSFKAGLARLCLKLRPFKNKLINLVLCGCGQAGTTAQCAQEDKKMVELGVAGGAAQQGISVSASLTPELGGTTCVPSLNQHLCLETVTCFSPSLCGLPVVPGQVPWPAIRVVFLKHMKTPSLHVSVCVRGWVHVCHHMPPCASVGQRATYG